MSVRRSAERVFEMVRKEFRQVLRDGRMRRVIFVAPIIQLVVFGYAVTTDYRNTATFVVDRDGSSASRQLLEQLEASRYFEIVDRSESPRDLVSALDHGRAILGVEIPSGFADDLRAGREAQVQLLFDGTNSNLATVARGYAETIIARFGASTVAGGRPAPLELEERAWFNADLTSRDYNVPAVVGTIVMLVCLMLTSLAVVREREIGTLEQLQVSPLRAGELIAGKTIPFALIGLVDLTAITVVALLWFDVPFRGSFLELLLASVLYLTSALGIGLLISTVSTTQQEAFMGSFLVFMPTILLSGFMFPVRSMPAVFRWLTVINPMRHFLEIVRGIFLKGTGLAELWPQYLALFLIGAALLALAASRFHRQA